MFDAYIQFFLSAAAIIVAGIFLARSSDKIAELTNMGRLFAGSILLAGATSLPELMVDVSAIRKGMPDLAVGDLMGSSLMNLLILGIADLVHRSPHKMFSRAGAQHALSAAMSINVTVLAAIAILLGPQLAGIEVGEIGIGVLAIGVAYILGLRLVYYDQQLVVRGEGGATSQGTNKRGALSRAISIYMLSALVIFIAAPFLADAAGEIADLTGLGKTFIGSTLVAFCTSLPEVVSTITAIRMGAFDLAVGNIFGSNSFNMIVLIPLDWFHQGNLLASVSNTHVLTALAIILATSVAVMGQLYHEEKRKKFIEPDALAVIGIVVGALLLLYWVG
ncbi:MAG: sodium:calcium antiporter [Oligoflexales bacterium]|nr:sodium:calcium antiporter [Oligoflexales bacterium]